jgi:poly(A) polymerase
VNSTYNVGLPQLRRIQEEMIRAAILLEEGEHSWRNIFRGSDFFERHSNYLQITIRASNAEDFLKWLRLCESRLRLLITSLETPQVSAWPFAQFFRRKYTKTGVVASGAQQSHDDCLHESFFFVALRFAPGVDTVNLRYCTSDFLYKVNSWEERKEGMDLGIAHVLQEDLPSFVFNVPCTSLEVANAASSEAPEDRTGRPSNKEESSTRLTPKLARSTLSEADVVSPAKRARKGL